MIFPVYAIGNFFCNTDNVIGVGYNIYPEMLKHIG